MYIHVHVYMCMYMYMYVTIAWAGLENTMYMYMYIVHLSVTVFIYMYMYICNVPVSVPHLPDFPAGGRDIQVVPPGPGSGGMFMGKNYPTEDIDPQVIMRENNSLENGIDEHLDVHVVCTFYMYMYIHGCVHVHACVLVCTHEIGVLICALMNHAVFSGSHHRKHAVCTMQCSMCTYMCTCRFVHA